MASCNGGQKRYWGRVTDSLLANVWPAQHRAVPDDSADVGNVAGDDEQRVYVETFGATNRASTQSDRETSENLVMNFDPAEVPKFVDRDHKQQILFAATDGGNSRIDITETDRSEK